jgi:hypothetical protein
VKTAKHLAFAAHCRSTPRKKSSEKGRKEKRKDVKEGRKDMK